MVAALTLAGSDSGGGAGIQADLKTFEAFGVFGTSVITALTAQNTLSVSKVMQVPDEMVSAQIEAVTHDFSIGAAKTGMLFAPSTIEVIASALKKAPFPLVCDPVMVASSGVKLLQDEAIHSLRTMLLPLASVITPNLPEAEILAQMPITTQGDMERAAQILGGRYPKAWILIKGGHSAPDTGMISDLLWRDSQGEWISGPRISTPNTHGTGCTLSAAIVANLALGKNVPDSVREAKKFLTQALKFAWASLGKGKGTLRHNYRFLQNP